MISLNELKDTKEYWLENIQNDLYNNVLDYMDENDLNRTQLAEELDFSKGYISQILNGNFNFSISKYIDLALKTNHYPVINFKKKNNNINSKITKVIQLNTSEKPNKNQQLFKNII